MGSPFDSEELMGLFAVEGLGRLFGSVGLGSVFEVTGRLDLTFLGELVRSLQLILT